MSQQPPQHYDYPPPPAPHTPGSAGTGPGLSPRGLPVQQRRRPISAILPPAIATNVLGAVAAGSPVVAPYSAITYAGGGSGNSHLYPPPSPTPWAHGNSNSSSNPQTQLAVPGTPMEPYNPRQWGHRGQVSGSQIVFQPRGNNPAAPSTLDVSGMEAAMPSPPPPYSPNTPDVPHRANIASPMMENIGFAASPLSQQEPSTSARQSPQMPMSPAFPPPPGPSSRHRERSSSGLAGRSGFFGLSGLRGKQPAHHAEPAPTSNPAQMPMEVPRPPAARRAASAGHVHTHVPAAGPSSAAAAAASGSAGRESPESGWQPGMPLPGPPPGPPPSGSRSQSLNRPMGSASASSSADPDRGEIVRTRRALPASSLGPIPPTPADWVTGAPNPQNLQMADRPPMPVDGATMEPLRIDTSGVREASLTRRPAKRGESASGLRDRRSRSRQAKGSDEGAGPSNLVFSPVEGSISRRREHTRTMSHYNEPNSAPSSSSGGGTSSGNSGATTKAGENVLTPPYTPAVGRTVDEQLRKQVLKVPGSASSDRPISHLLHAPNEEINGMSAPLSPGRPPSSGSLYNNKVSTAKLDAFALQAIERHRSFVEREVAATSDEERLELFANFIVHESRLRRDRYTAAYNAMAGDIVDLTRDMWRSYNNTNTRGGAGIRRAGTPSTAMSSYDPTVPNWGGSSQPNSARGSTFEGLTPGADSPSVGSASDGAENRQWPEAFKPSLSPIPSMAVSTVPDEHDSRGRTASRWWEQSASGSGSIGRPDRMEKTRRETKYMGVTPATLQEEEADGDNGNQRGTPVGMNGKHGQAYGYGPDEYPPEKVGLHEGYDYDTPMATPQRIEQRNTATPGVEPLDVSRLVTLPPPYPRHHPAVSNSHPLLADLRAEHRVLVNHEEIIKIKDAYHEKDMALTREQEEATKQRRAKLRAGIQSKIADGSMSFADAAQAEANFDVEEAERGKTTARSNFDVFESDVAHPLNTLLTERLARADAAIKSLTTELATGQEAAGPDQAQEEGDERPERLEKLTLLKWLFEARELLHKEMFDLHNARSDKYSAVILTPYRISKQQAKLDEATAFFTKDARTRQITFAQESQKRFETLQTVFDQNVTQGVEDQLSAFWDIAPGLLEVVQQVPVRDAELARCDIVIPPQEYEENPSYHEHPLQYLYSLLDHAHKSAFQFIESQINLLCLLHEVKTATTKSSLRLVEMERLSDAAAAAKNANAAAGSSSPPPNGQASGNAEAQAEIIAAEMQQARRAAEDHLTLDLKEKVGEVERQWKEALGDGMTACRRRVGAWLEKSGGLEDGLEV